jgi:hypothetical protein
MFRTPLSLDRTHRILTLVSFAIVALVLVIALSTGRNEPVVIVAIVTVALGLAWAMSPCALVIDGGEMRIERRAWRPLRVPLASIASAAPIGTIGKRALRLWGVGGFFGSYGLFWSDALGRFRLYGTRRGQAVLVRRNDGRLPLVLTPDDVAGTVDAIDKRPLLTE